MAGSRLRWAVVGLLLVSLGCNRPDTDETSQVSRGLELPPAPEGNFFETAWEAQALDERVVIIPLAAWEAAVNSGDRATMQAPNTQRVKAAEAAAVANDLWAAGAFSEPVEEGEQEFSANDIVVVALDPQVTADGRVLTANYFISGAAVSGSSPWLARRVSIAIRPNAAGGGGRCCGPQNVGQQLWPSLDELPSLDCVPSPIAMCFDNKVGIIGPSEAPGPGALRTQADMAPIPFVMFGPTGEEHRLEFFGPFGGMGSTSCTHTSYDCTTEQPVAGLGSSWEAEVPRSGSACAPGASPVSGRHVPPQCAMANVTLGIDPLDPTGGMDVMRPAGGSAPLAECDGRCPSCSEPSSMWNTDVVPRQCWFVETAGDDDVCGLNTTALIEQYQAQIRDFEVQQTSDSCMDLSDPTAKCGACRSVGDAIGHSGLEFCSRCSEPVASGGQTNCRRYPHRIGTPIDEVADLSAGGQRLDVASVGLQTMDKQRSVISCSSPQCGQSASSPVRPSGAPRPGMAQTAEPLTDLNAANRESNDTGKTVTDDPTKTTHADDGKTVGDPVNVVDGSFVLSQTDLSFPGPHRALSFSRYYSSQTTTRGVLGSNWVHNWEVRVIPLSKANMPSWVDPYCAGTPMETTCIMLVSGESSRLFYLDQLLGLYVPQAGSMATVKRTSTGWVVRQPDRAQARLQPPRLPAIRQGPVRQRLRASLGVHRGRAPV